MALEKRSKSKNKATVLLEDTQVRVNFDYSYIHKSKQVDVHKGEILELLQKTNEHWWKCLRFGQPKSFYVPALYVSVIEDEETDERGRDRDRDPDDPDPDPELSCGCSTDDENLNEKNCDSSQKRTTSRKEPGLKQRSGIQLQSFQSQNQNQDIEDTQSLNSIPPNHSIVLETFSPVKSSTSTSARAREDREREGNFLSRRYESASSSSLRYDKVNNISNSSCSSNSLKNINNGSISYNWSKSLEDLSSQIGFPGQGQSTIFFNNPGFKSDQDNRAVESARIGKKTQVGIIDIDIDAERSRRTPDSLDFESTIETETQNVNEVDDTEQEDQFQDQEPHSSSNKCDIGDGGDQDPDQTSSARSSQEDILVPTEENLIRILQNNWSEYKCQNSDRIFYYNSLTKCTSWKPPRISKVESNNNIFTVPKGWTQNVDEVNGTVSFISQISGSKVSGKMENISVEASQLLDSILEQTQWFTSTDPTGKIYFYEENSSKSSWFLPAEENAEHTTSSRSRGESSSQFQSQRRHDGLSSSCESSEVEETTKSFKRHSTGDREHVTERTQKSQSLLLLNFSAPVRTGAGIGVRSSSSMNRNINVPVSIWEKGNEPRPLYENFLNRTKLLEHNKKVRKNWTTSWAVLTDAHISFFKDQKSLSASPIRSELEVDLIQSSVEWTKEKDKSSRKNVFLITTPHLELLCQLNNQGDADEWFSKIQGQIKDLQEFDNFDEEEEITMRLKGGSLPKSSSDYMEAYAGGDGTYKRKSSSKIKITTTAGEQQKLYQDYRSQLKKFFNRRPPRESLVKKGIYKDERVFGCHLEKLTALEGKPVPIFVEKCIEVIESKDENMKTDGIYRASGNLSQVQRIRLQVDQDNMSVLEQEDDVHVLAGSLKLFFREMREPVLPTSLFDRFLRACQLQRDDKLKEFQQLVKALPDTNFRTLKTLLEHLLRVSSYSEFNRMQIPNLAIVFGPTLMWNSIESNSMAIDLMQQNYVVEILLTEFNNLFNK